MEEELYVYLTADNSSGKQQLYLTKNENGMWFTLCGNYRGDEIQIDFNDSSVEELEELKTMIEIMIESKQK